MKSRLFVMTFISVIISTTHATSRIELLGVDHSGKEVSTKVSVQELANNNTKLFGAFGKETIDAIDRQEQTSKTWEFNKFEIGLGASAGFELSSALKASVSPSFTLVYKRLK